MRSSNIRLHPVLNSKKLQDLPVNADIALKQRARRLEMNQLKISYSKKSLFKIYPKSITIVFQCYIRLQYMKTQDELNNLFKAYFSQFVGPKDIPKEKSSSSRKQVLRKQTKLSSMQYQQDISQDQEGALAIELEEIVYNLAQKYNYDGKSARQQDIKKQLKQDIDSFKLKVLEDEQMKKIQNFVKSHLLPSLQQIYPQFYFLVENTLKTYFLKQKFIILRISNSETKYKMIFGQEYREMLDPRDIVLEHNFDKDFRVELEDLEKNYILQTQFYNQLCQFIKNFLVQTVNNILSISFNRLNDGKLESSEVKTYSAENIMINIQSLYLQIFKAIDKQPKIKEKINIQGLKISLIKKIEEITNNILINLSDQYPQAPITGGTPRMNNIIEQVNKVQNEENDLIFANDIKISGYLDLFTYSEQSGKKYEQINMREDEDYTQFIMQAVNKVIKVVQNNNEDMRQRTRKEVFADFNEELFILAKDQNFRSLVDYAINNEEKQNSENKNEAKQIIHNLFAKTLEGNSIRLKQINQRFSTYTNKNKKEANNNRSQLKVNGMQVGDLLNQIGRQRESHLQEIKASKCYQISPKVPNYVQEFKKKEIASKEFTAKHSSILRILTKWASYLEDIFADPQKYILQRLYPFKNIHNQTVLLQNSYYKLMIVKQLGKEYQKVKEKLNAIKDQNIEFISQFMAKQDLQLSYIKRFTSTRKVSSKINAILTSFMVKYLSILIHHLLIAGKIRSNLTLYYYENINLVVFRVCDILRAKYKCNQATFITLLKVMYLLDESENMKNKFNLIRIKNKLNNPANNIIINYMFLGKIQCELQLSIQQSKGKQKNYYTFSHFVYELTRGSFGVISQCAIMISQLDPIINTCNQVYYSQKNLSQTKSRKYENKSLSLKSSLKENSNSLSYASGIKDNGNSIGSTNRLFLGKAQLKYQQFASQKIIKNTFECKTCHRLVINQLNSIFKDDKGSCIKCLLKIQQTELLLKDELSQILFQETAQKRLKRIFNYSQLDSKNRNKRLLICINPAGNIQPMFISFLERQRKHFLITVYPSYLQKFRLKNFDIKEISYINVQKLVNQKRLVDKIMLYETQTLQNFSQKFYKRMKIVKRADLNSKMRKIQLQFQNFRVEKELIKAIKLQQNIIDCRHYRQKWQTLIKIFQNINSQNAKMLKNSKYKKSQNISFQHIKQIYSTHNDISQIPQFINGCTHLSLLNLNSNKLKSISSLHFKHLKKLNVAQNQLTTIEYFEGAENLTELNTNFNKITNIDQIKKYVNLSTLTTFSNKIQNVEALAKLTKLEKLIMGYNKLVNIQPLSSLTKLKHLSITQNKIENLACLKTLINLQFLKFNENKIKSSQGLQTLTNLKILELQINELTQVDNLSTLNNLNVLNLSQNKLTDIKPLSNLSELTTLNLAQNKIENIDSLDALVNLTHLYLTSNSIVNIDKLNLLTKLMDLSLGKNKVQQITALSSLQNLVKLQLSFNSISNIEPLCKLRSINSLELSNNKVRSVEPLINIRSLRTLNLMNNEVEDVNVLLQLCDLIKLNIRDNKIQTQVEFSEMSKLQALTTENNQNLLIKSLPTSLQQLSADNQQLKDFDLSSLPIVIKYLVQNNRNKDIISNIANKLRK